MAKESTELPVFSADGKKSGTREVASSIFGAETKQGLLHQVVRWQRAKKRAGTHTVLTRSQVRGGGAKPWRQKGTGRARAGSSSSPVWVGGGVAHGPKQRKYDFKLNKKEKKQAICSALSARTQEGRALVVKDFGLSEIRTKEAVNVLRSLGVEKGDSALVISNSDDILSKSLRNVAGVRLLEPKAVNVYDVLVSKHLVIQEAALEAIESRLSEN